MIRPDSTLKASIAVFIASSHEVTIVPETGMAHEVKSLEHRSSVPSKIVGGCMIG